MKTQMFLNLAARSHGHRTHGAGRSVIDSIVNSMVHSAIWRVMWRLPVAVLLLVIVVGAGWMYYSRKMR